MVNIFLTGATGYVGGQALHAIASSYPASSTTIACLVRDESKADVVRRSFPDHVQIVLGDLGDVELIEKESHKADIVFNLASTNHLSSANAIAKGLSTKTGDSKSYWIQISGGTLFTVPEVKAGRFGEPPSKVIDDSKDIEDILTTIRETPSRAVDNLIMGQSPSRTRTALVVAPLIYGHGAGSVNQRSIQVPEIVRKTLEDGEGFRFLKGLNKWSDIHISDLGDLFVLLAQAALEAKSGCWNDEGIYLPATGALSFGEICKHVAEEAHGRGLIKSGEIARTIDVDEADQATPHGAILWGTNAVYASTRGQRLLAWRPSAPSLAANIPETVELEAKRLGKLI